MIYKNGSVSAQEAECCTVVLRGHTAYLPALEWVQKAPGTLGEIIPWLSKFAFWCIHAYLGKVHHKPTL